MEKALEELYSSDPSEFTKKRDALAKELKAHGDDEAASAVRARRKPTQIAWVLNQLARRHPDDVAELVDVGRELAREQRKALRGEASSSFRESIARQRKVVGDLTRRTAELMKELEVDPSGHLDEIASALQAALVDPAVGAQLEEGRLEKPPEAAAGFAGPSPERPLSRTPKKTRAKRPSAARPSRRADAAARKREEARERAERQAQALAQKRALAKERAERQAAERAEKKAIQALRAAEREADKRRLAAMKAEEEARKAIERAKELARAAEESAQLVAEAKRELARADGR